jgi:starch phosphorylase
MFGGYEIDAITNGVHAATWISDPFRALFDQRIPSWRADNFSLRYAVSIPTAEIWTAHLAAKLHLLEIVNRHQSPPLDPAVFTIGFGRRASSYKRADLLVSNIARLRDVARIGGRLQIVYAGKAHPRDEEGKRVIERVFRAREALRIDVPIVYLEDYDMATARLLTAGADVWLNTPHPPLEASGTSGMKAALNGVPSLSILDGWWVEGHVEGVTGWAIGRDRPDSAAMPADSAADAVALYDALERDVLPLYYGNHDRFAEMMRYAIALNGSFFTAQRMLQEYVIKAYGTESVREVAPVAAARGNLAPALSVADWGSPPPEPPA